MSRAKVVRRSLLGTGVFLLVVALMAVAVVVGQVRRSFPQTDGEITVPGLDAKVSVLRDAQGVPQIYADTAADLFRAQGYVAAQDRFFQMDLRRHVTAGRLSELVGSAGLETDKVIRTMGWRRVAEAELPTLSSSTRQYLQAYADGVNAYLDTAGSPSDISLEYAVLGLRVKGYRVEEWTPADSLAWLKAMAWDLRGNYENELTRARLAGKMSLSHIRVLYPDYPLAEHPPILSSRDWSSSSASPSLPPPSRSRTAVTVPSYLASKQASPRVFAGVVQALDAVPVLLGRGDAIGSNSWVVGPSRSTTGKPLLANDPHLGVGIPGIWTQVGLHCRTVSDACPFDVAGFAFSGVPGVVIGHNQTIAWGFTNLDPDVTDFYLERVSGNTYERDGALRPLATRTETIKVAGGPDEKVLVRSTVHGPLMSDVVPEVASAGQSAPVDGRPDSGTYAVSLAWTGLQPDKTADALFAIDLAQSFAEFRAAASNFAAPAQNLLYADVNGHIGYQAPGKVPVRESATPGTPPGYWPAPGWNSSYDWKGYVPFAQMPSSYDPPEGLIVTANQEVSADPSPFLTSEYDAGFRAGRIRSLLLATPKATPARMHQIQMDTRNTFAPTLVKVLLGVKVDSFTASAQRLLKGWDYTQPSGLSRSGAAAAYYNAVWHALLTLTFDDELPADLKADGSDRWMLAVAQLLQRPRDAWWDNKLTPSVTEGRDEILRQAMENARLELTKALGKNPITWQWGRLHQLTLRSSVLGGEAAPPYLQALFNRGGHDMPGGSAIVDANGWNAANGQPDNGDYQVTAAPSMRMVVDLGALDSARWVNQTGSSGHPYSGHYDDQVDAWIDGEMFDWPFTEKAVRAATVQELTLVPGTPNS